MKRKTLKFTVCATVMALSLSVTACGGSNSASKQSADVEETVDTEDTTESEADVEVDTDAEEDTEAEVETGDSEEYTTLEDYYSAYQSEMDAMFDAMGGDGMTVAVEVSGNELITIIKIEDASIIDDTVGEQLEAALDAMADTFKEYAAQLDDSVGQEGACTVTLRYTDPDDNLLAEKSFQAD